MNVAIEMVGVSKMFSRNKALDEVSFTVAPGEIFALLGDNGAGKSTAIRTLLGLVDADRGHARMLGLDARTHGEEIRRQIGYVPDQPVLYEWMSVDQIGWFASGFAKTGYLTDYRSRVKAFGLSPTAKIKSLSKGMKAKVSLALPWLATHPFSSLMSRPPGSTRWCAGSFSKA
jgi:ABC-2 type transport system ATP-binding protein